MQYKCTCTFLYSGIAMKSRAMSVKSVDIKRSHFFGRVISSYLKFLHSPYFLLTILCLDSKSLFFKTTILSMSFFLHYRVKVPSVRYIQKHLQRILLCSYLSLISVVYPMKHTAHQCAAFSRNVHMCTVYM